MCCYYYTVGINLIAEGSACGCMVRANSNTTLFLFLEEPVKQEAVVKQEIKQEKTDDKANSIKPPPEKRAKLTR